jgi:hypothetical protein
MLIFQTIGSTARIQTPQLQILEIACVLGKKIPWEMEAPTAAAAGVTLLLVHVPMAKAAATFLTKNTVT